VSQMERLYDARGFGKCAQTVTYMFVSAMQVWRVIRSIVLIVGDNYTMPDFAANQDGLCAPRALPPRSGGQHQFSGMRSSYENDDDVRSGGR
jgi:hypothetical protein